MHSHRVHDWVPSLKTSFLVLHLHSHFFFFLLSFFLFLFFFCSENFVSTQNEDDLNAWYDKIRSVSKADGIEEESAIYLGRYEAGRTIGEGGYAEVKLGVDLVLQRKVAIKVINKDLGDAKGLERLEREISFLCCMEHPNIVKLYDVMDGDSTAVIIMEFVEGQTLDDVVYQAKGHYLPDYVCRYLFKQVSTRLPFFRSH